MYIFATATKIHESVTVIDEKTNQLELIPT